MASLFQCPNCKTIKKMDYVGPLLIGENKNLPTLRKFRDFYLYTCRECKSTLSFGTLQSRPILASSSVSQ
jgi:hypothetical protein